MNFPFDLFIVEAPESTDGKVVATGLVTPTPSVTPSDDGTTGTPGSSPDPEVPTPTPQPGIPTIDGQGLGLHPRASSKVGEGNLWSLRHANDDEIAGEARTRAG